MLKLNDGYYVDYNGTQYTLSKEHMKSTLDKETNQMINVRADINLGYHATLQSALKQYVRECTGQSIMNKDITLSEVFKIIQNLHKEIARYG